MLLVRIATMYHRHMPLVVSHEDKNSTEAKAGGCHGGNIPADVARPTEWGVT